MLIALDDGVAIKSYKFHKACAGKLLIRKQNQSCNQKRMMLELGLSI